MLALVAGSAPSVGCSVLCRGPGCEDSWPQGVVVVHRGAPDLSAGQRDVWDDAEGRFDGAPADGSGWSVAAFGGAVVLGQPEDDKVLRVTDRPVTGPIGTEETLVTLLGPALTRFGDAVVALPDGAGSVVLFVGAPETSFDRGALYAFPAAGTLEGTLTVLESEWFAVGASVGDRLGDHLTACGDVTGDGLPELAVTIPWFSRPDDSRWPLPDAEVPSLGGAVWLLTSEGFAAADADTPFWELGPVWFGTDLGEGAGTSVLCDRDLSGDGIADVVVGSPWANDATGRVTVLVGGPTLPGTGPLGDGALRVLDGPDAGGWFGVSMASMEVGGQVLVAIGGAGASGGTGRVHLYPAVNELLNPDRLVPRRRATFLSEAERTLPDHFGRFVAAADIDADGDDDLLVGAPDYRLGTNGFDAGRVWLYPGSAADAWTLITPTDLASVVIAGSQPFQRTGRAPVLADLDSDGDADILLPTRAGPTP